MPQAWVLSLVYPTHAGLTFQRKKERASDMIEPSSFGTYTNSILHANIVSTYVASVINVYFSSPACSRGVPLLEWPVMGFSK